ncbi:MAG TPA: hypothetical protein PLF63_03910 [Rubrivivax sp.]|nr:hypothetical protein [Rubrivivax sp.]
MELIDNINRLLGDDLKRSLKPGARLKVAASCFSMYAFEALKEELEQVDELCFIFTSPTFVAEEVTDKIRKERKQFHIPKLNRERSLYGSEFEIRLRIKLTQRAIARVCADPPLVGADGAAATPVRHPRKNDARAAAADARRRHPARAATRSRRRLCDGRCARWAALSPAAASLATNSRRGRQGGCSARGRWTATVAVRPAA